MRTGIIPERVAWSYQDALEEEDGNQAVPLEAIV